MSIWPSNTSVIIIQKFTCGCSTGDDFQAMLAFISIQGRVFTGVAVIVLIVIQDYDLAECLLELAITFAFVSPLSQLSI
jgi:hypothetical protein